MKEIKEHISLVAGSTGLVGRTVVKEIASRGEKVIALTRKERNSDNDFIKYLLVDYDQLEDSRHQFSEVSNIYICLGTTKERAGSEAEFRKVDFDYCLEIGKLALECGAKNLSIISSVGSDPDFSNSIMTKHQNLYLKTKGQLEVEIGKLNYESISIYKPGLLVGDRKKIGAGKQELLLNSIFGILSKITDPFLMGSFSKYRSVNVETLAKSMIDNISQHNGVQCFHFEDF